ncbi:hypothetical protein BpHYR1_018480 [Brachionus plicatilis]|uniref:Uncharacterized protein n=1 Tax=Brachionus plicatilis TaxID=10195 RepID=A0A3M7RGS0_BRAPC|nr:hypothetical protein BpHYR1_018480 [Brachionus plicatilis]
MKKINNKIIVINYIRYYTKYKISIRFKLIIVYFINFDCNSSKKEEFLFAELKLWHLFLLLVLNYTNPFLWSLLKPGPPIFYLKKFPEDLVCSKLTKMIDYF